MGLKTTTFLTTYHWERKIANKTKEPDATIYKGSKYRSRHRKDTIVMRPQISLRHIQYYSFFIENQS